jgi:hypothetical protein
VIAVLVGLVPLVVPIPVMLLGVFGFALSVLLYRFCFIGFAKAKPSKTEQNRAKPIH